MLSTLALILAPLLVTGAVIERYSARVALSRAIAAQHDALLAELERFRADYARDFLALREDHARALAKLERSVDVRLEAFIAELLDVSQSVSTDPRTRADDEQL